MSTKPGTLPTWATTAGTTTAPSSGQQAAGFTVSTTPPAKWMNWLMNWIFQWLAYLNNPVGSGATAGFTASGDPAGSGHGLVGNGGGTGGFGVAGYINAAGYIGGAFYGYPAGSPGSMNGNGVEGTGSGSGYGVNGAGGTTGIGGVFIGGGTSGYGVYVTSGNSVSAPIHITPQASAPSTGAIGDMYINNSGVLRICTVAGSPGTWVDVGAQT